MKSVRPIRRGGPREPASAQSASAAARPRPHAIRSFATPVGRLSASALTERPMLVVAPRQLRSSSATDQVFAGNGRAPAPTPWSSTKCRPRRSAQRRDVGAQIAVVASSRRPATLRRAAGGPHRPSAAVERDLRLGLEHDLLRNPRLALACAVARPFLRRIQPVGDRQARMAIGQRQRHRHLAVVLLAELTAILPRHADPMRPCWESSCRRWSTPKSRRPLDLRQHHLAHLGIARAKARSPRSLWAYAMVIMLARVSVDRDGNGMIARHARRGRPSPALAGSGRSKGGNSRVRDLSAALSRSCGPLHATARSARRARGCRPGGRLPFIETDWQCFLKAAFARFAARPRRSSWQTAGLERGERVENWSWSSGYIWRPVRAKNTCFPQLRSAAGEGP